MAVILDGRVDIGYIRLPADTRGLCIEPLFTEPRVVVLPEGHHLAGKERVRITDLADDHLLQDPDAVPEWRDIAAELRNRHGRFMTTPLVCPLIRLPSSVGTSCQSSPVAGRRSAGAIGWPLD